MGPQFFGSRDDRTGQAVRAMEGAVANREFRFDKHSALHNQRALLLACGEIGVVSGRTNVDYHEFVGSSINLRDAIKNANIILNPTHTRIADRGVLLAKRAILSKNRRVCLSASNWDKRGERTQHISPTIHSLWYNGREKTCDSCFESDRFCYREWNAVG